MADEQSSQAWFWLVGIPVLAAGIVFFNSAYPRMLEGIFDEILYWVNYVVPSAIRSVLGA